MATFIRHIDGEKKLIFNIAIYNLDDYLVRIANIFDHFFDKVLRSPVRVRTFSGWMILVDRKIFRISENRWRRRKNDSLHSELVHNLQFKNILQVFKFRSEAWSFEMDDKLESLIINNKTLLW